MTNEKKGIKKSALLKLKLDAIVAIGIFEA